MGKLTDRPKRRQREVHRKEAGKGKSSVILPVDKLQDGPPVGPAEGEIELSIVMPCLNEAETIATCITKAKSFLAEAEINGEIVVGDNGSTDGSQEIARELGARVVDVTPRGYGAAIRGATLASRGKYIIMGDADDSYDFSALELFVAGLREGKDLVMGNRFMGGIEPGAMPWKNRHLGNPLLSWVGRLFFHCPARDLHCGLRGFSRQAFERMDLHTTGMEFASEMVIKANLLGMEISEMPTKLHPDGRTRAPHLRPWRDGWRHLRFMLLYSPRWLFLYPGMLLMMVGLTVVFWLLPGSRTVGGVTLDIHTLLYAGIAVLVGYQGVWFAVLARVFGIVSGLLPAAPKHEKWYQLFRLELGLIVGLVLLVGGLGAAVFSVVLWGQKGYGALVPSQMLRVIIPSGVAMTLGCQTIMSSFFLGLLGVRRK